MISVAHLTCKNKVMDLLAFAGAAGFCKGAGNATTLFIDSNSNTTTLIGPLIVSEYGHNQGIFSVNVPCEVTMELKIKPNRTELGGQGQLHTVKCGPDVIGEFCAKRVIIQIDMHVGQDGLFGAGARDPLKGQIQMGMGGMRFAA